MRGISRLYVNLTKQLHKNPIKFFWISSKQIVWSNILQKRSKFNFSRVLIVQCHCMQMLLIHNWLSWITLSIIWRNWSKRKYDKPLPTCRARFLKTRILMLTANLWFSKWLRMWHVILIEKLTKPISEIN